jgi:hypothetical protein
VLSAIQPRSSYSDENKTLDLSVILFSGTTVAVEGRETTRELEDIHVQDALSESGNVK